MAFGARVVVESKGATEILVRNRARMARLDDFSVELEAAQRELYGATQAWYDSQGEGSWPALAESTVAEKARLGIEPPDTPLVRRGMLRESVISASGPYSFVVRTPHSILVGADWLESGWQIPVVLSEGDSTHPARHIWPDHESIEAAHMRAAIGELLLRGI